MYGYKKGPPHAYTQYGVGYPKVTQQPSASISQSQVGLAQVSLDTTALSVTSAPVYEPERWPPKDHFLFALLVTIFCCLPLGLLALLFVFQGRKYVRGNSRKQAAVASSRALRLSVAALAIGCGITVLAIGIISARASMMCDKTSWVCVERVFGSDD